MRHLASHGLQSAASGRQWLAPHPLGASSSSSSLRTQHSRFRTAAAPPDAVALVDLIQWPEGTRPKRGGVTKASLTRLKLAELKAELSRLGAADTSGTKDQLAEKLLQAITAHATGAPAPAQAAPSAAAVAETPAIAPVGRLAAAEQKVVTAPAPAAAAPTAAPAAAAAAAPRQRPVPRSTRQQPAADTPAAAQSHTSAATAAAAAAAATLPPRNSSSSTSGSSASASDEAAKLALAAKLLLQKHGEIVQLGRMPQLDPQEAVRIAAAVGVDLEALPPLTQRSRGHVYAVDALPGMDEEDREMVLKAIRSGLALTLLGGSTGDPAAGDCAPSCLGLVRDKDIWLFDVGEDVQRSLLHREHLKPSKMHRVVVTRQAPDAMLGLPGCLCVIGSSREKGHETADIPVHVFGPPGTGDYLSTMYECSNTFLEMPVVVHEFVTHAVAEEQMLPQPLNSRAKLWRALMPPDQLNPMGFIDGDIQAFMPTQGRARFRKGQRAAGGVLASNPRAGYRPMATPPPGDPTRTDLSPADMTWTVVADEAATMTAVMLDADVPSWGVVWREADRQGNLSVPRCQALHISDEALYKNLKNGETVQNDQGVSIPAPMVCTEDKPGRTLVLLPACNSADNIGPHAVNADIMIAAAGAAAAYSGGQIGAGLGMCAQQWRVRNLLVTAMPVSASPAGGSIVRRRPRSSSEEGGQEEQQQQQEVQPLDPAAAAALCVIAEQYTRGTVIPARDDMSLILEENLGELDPPEIDLQEIAATARATSLQGERKGETTNEKSLQRRARREEHRELAKDGEPLPQQQQQQQQPQQPQQPQQRQQLQQDRGPQRWQQEQHGGWQQQRQQQQRDWKQRQGGQAGQQGWSDARPRRSEQQQQPYRQQQQQPQQQQFGRQHARPAAGSQTGR